MNIKKDDIRKGKNKEVYEFNFWLFDEISKRKNINKQIEYKYDFCYKDFNYYIINTENLFIDITVYDDGAVWLEYDDSLNRNCNAVFDNIMNMRDPGTKRKILHYLDRGEKIYKNENI